MLHDTIYSVRKAADFTFNKQYVPLSDETANTWYTNEESTEKSITNSKGIAILEGSVRRYNKADISAPGPRPGTEAHYQWKGHWPPPGRHWAYRREAMEKLESHGKLVYSKSGRVYEKRYLDESAGIPAQSIWSDVSFVRGMSKHRAESEWLDYPTQKPEALLDRIIRASSNEGDIVLDCFAGSGTTAAVAEKLNRRWITCDLSRFSVHTTRKRFFVQDFAGDFLEGDFDAGFCRDLFGEFVERHDPDQRGQREVSRNTEEMCSRGKRKKRCHPEGGFLPEGSLLAFVFGQSKEREILRYAQNDIVMRRAR